MQCPNCKHKKNKVVHVLRFNSFDSRAHICLNCNFVFSTKCFADKEFQHPGFNKRAAAQNDFQEYLFNENNPNK